MSVERWRFPGAARRRRVRGRVTCGPEARARRRVALGDDVERSLGLGDRGDELEVGRHRPLRPGRFDEERRSHGEGRPPVRVDGGDRPGVEELDPRDAGARRDDRRRRPARGLHVGERETEDDGLLGNALEAERQLGDHPERPLRADQQPQQVVSRRRLRRAAPGADDTAAGQHRLERERVGAHLPVAHAHRPRGVRRGHPPERRVGPGVDREEEPVLRRRPLERRARDARLRRRGQVGGVDGEDGVHPGEVEGDAAVERDHVPLEARPGPERRHRDPVLVREREHRDDVVGRRRVDDDVGAVRTVEREVAGVEVALGVAVGDAPRVAEGAHERIPQVVGPQRHHFSRGCQSKRRSATASPATPQATTTATAPRSWTRDSPRRYAAWMRRIRYVRGSTSATAWRTSG